jgi:hypothetical protein
LVFQLMQSFSDFARTTNAQIVASLLLSISGWKSCEKGQSSPLEHVPFFL